MILPPMTARKIIDTTAKVVAEYGVMFEKKLIEDRKGDSKYSFLNPDDPFHMYYQEVLEQAKSGKLQEATKQNKATAQTSFIPKPQQKILPPSFTYRQPEEIGALQLDVIHQTAQYAALYGKEFLQLIAKKEKDTPIFAFLKPDRPYFRFFAGLIEQYKLAIDPSNLLKRRLEQEAASINVIRQNIEAQAEYEKQLIEQKKKEAEEAKSNSINDQFEWDDFKVLATIEYDGEDVHQQPQQQVGPTVQRTLKTIKPMQQISPFTGQKVALEEFGKHIKFEAVNPQYQKEIETMRERKENQNSSYARGDEIAENLKQFAKGTTEAVPNPIIWDGREETIPKVVAETANRLTNAPKQPKRPHPPVIGPKPKQNDSK